MTRASACRLSLVFRGWLTRTTRNEALKLPWRFPESLGLPVCGPRSALRPASYFAGTMADLSVVNTA